jgi:hypothetical protein
VFRSGHAISPDCIRAQIIDIYSDEAERIFESYLKTGRVKIHPNQFTI